MGWRCRKNWNDGKRKQGETGIVKMVKREKRKNKERKKQIHNYNNPTTAIIQK
jgi:hypothetical protein